jgi:hypothetical protein
MAAMSAGAGVLRHEPATDSDPTQPAPGWADGSGDGLPLASAEPASSSPGPARHPSAASHPSRDSMMRPASASTTRRESPAPLLPVALNVRVLPDPAPLPPAPPPAEVARAAWPTEGPTLYVAPVSPEPVAEVVAPEPVTAQVETTPPPAPTPPPVAAEVAPEPAIVQAAATGPAPDAMARPTAPDPDEPDSQVTQALAQPDFTPALWEPPAEAPPVPAVRPVAAAMAGSVPSPDTYRAPLEAPGAPAQRHPSAKYRGTSVGLLAGRSARRSTTVAAVSPPAGEPTARALAPALAAVDPRVQQTSLAVPSAGPQSAEDPADSALDLDSVPVVGATIIAAPTAPEPVQPPPPEPVVAPPEPAPMVTEPTPAEPARPAEPEPIVEPVATTPEPAPATPIAVEPPAEPEPSVAAIPSEPVSDAPTMAPPETVPGPEPVSAPSPDPAVEAPVGPIASTADAAPESTDRSLPQGPDLPAIEPVDDAAKPSEPPVVVEPPVAAEPPVVVEPAPEAPALEAAAPSVASIDTSAVLGDLDRRPLDSALSQGPWIVSTTAEMDPSLRLLPADADALLLDFEAASSAPPVVAQGMANPSASAPEAVRNQGRRSVRSVVAGWFGGVRRPRILASRSAAGPATAANAPAQGLPPIEFPPTYYEAMDCRTEAGPAAPARAIRIEPPSHAMASRAAARPLRPGTASSSDRPEAVASTTQPARPTSPATTVARPGVVASIRERWSTRMRQLWGRDEEEMRVPAAPSPRLIAARPPQEATRPATDGPGAKPPLFPTANLAGARYCEKCQKLHRPDPDLLRAGAGGNVDSTAARIRAEAADNPLETSRNQAAPTPR